MSRQQPPPVAVLSAAWRTLRRMRTAIILLLILAAGAAVGAFFPQRPVSPLTANAWVEDHRSWARIAEFFGLLDVYGSWWFMAISVLLLVSLVGCLLPRYRAFFRAVRARPRAAAALEVQPHYRTGEMALAPEAALHGAERLLRDRRFRLAREDGTVAAEKGHWREGGSLVFHTALLALLIGMAAGKLFGHSGQVAVIEGETFRDTRIEYDSLSAGRFFPGHKGFGVTLEAFDVDWYPNGVPSTFVARTSILDQEGTFVRPYDVYVNSPLTYDGVRLYLLSWGWAPEIRVRQNGAVLYDGPTVFLSDDGSWRGVVKTPGAEPLEMGLEMFFVPDAVLGDDGTPVNGGPRPENPLVVYQQYLGDLRLEEPQSVYALDPRELAPGAVGALRLGRTEGLGDGIEVSFTGLKQYAVFHVASNPGAPVLLVAAILLLVGLIPALYSSRRRVWVRATLHGDAARVEIAGNAAQRKAAFEEEFTELVRDLDRDLHARMSADSAPDGRRIGAQIGGPDG
ncbi:MAG TPA: cytochrome c biogenesis protein ResB [Actinomycetota bacterium]